MHGGGAMLGRAWRAIYLFLLHGTLVQAAELAFGLTTLPETSAARGRTERFYYEIPHEWPCNGCEQFPPHDESKAALASRGPKQPYLQVSSPSFTKWPRLVRRLQPSWPT